MLLGLSSLEAPGEETAGVPAGDNPAVEMAAVGGSEHGDGGVAQGALLTRFAERVHGAEPGPEPDRELAAARDDVEAALGPAGLVDAAAICANFTMMVRIADGTGTPLDEGTVAISTDLRADLGLDDLTSRRLVDG